MAFNPDDVIRSLFASARPARQPAPSPAPASPAPASTPEEGAILTPALAQPTPEQRVRLERLLRYVERGRSDALGETRRALDAAKAAYYGAPERERERHRDALTRAAQAHREREERCNRFFPDPARLRAHIDAAAMRAAVAAAVQAAEAAYADELSRREHGYPEMEYAG